jgi:hypothetical protein
MTAITRPSNMPLQDWADQMSLDLDQYGTVGRLLDEVRWRDWAVQFLNNTSLGRNLPNPYSFDKWQDWAERFCQSLS